MELEQASQFFYEKDRRYLNYHYPLFRGLLQKFDDPKEDPSFYLSKQENDLEALLL